MVGFNSFPLPTPTIDMDDPEAAKEDLARLTREDYEYRKQLLAPYEEELRDLADDNSLVEDAEKRAASIASRGAAQTNRMLGRYGVQRTGAVARAANRGAQLSQARTGTSMVNNARDMQDTLQFNALGQGVAQGRRRLNNAFAMLGDSAGMASNRQGAYNSAMQQYRANRNSTIASGLGLAAFAFGI